MVKYRHPIHTCFAEDEVLQHLCKRRLVCMRLDYFCALDMSKLVKFG